MDVTDAEIRDPRFVEQFLITGTFLTGLKSQVIKIAKDHFPQMSIFFRENLNLLDFLLQFLLSLGSFSKQAILYKKIHCAPHAQNTSQKQVGHNLITDFSVFIDQVINFSTILTNYFVELTKKIFSLPFNQQKTRNLVMIKSIVKTFSFRDLFCAC